MSMSAMASPPSASITATSIRTRPRSWTGTNDALVNVFDSSAGSVAARLPADRTGLTAHAPPHPCHPR
jgi:hypothetical protein